MLHSEFCACPDDIVVPGFIRREGQRGDKLCCIVCRKSFDPARPMPEVDIARAPIKIFKAYRNAIDDLHHFARNWPPVSAADIQQAIGIRARYITYLYNTLLGMNERPVIDKEGNFWKLEKIAQTEEQS